MMSLNDTDDFKAKRNVCSAYDFKDFNKGRATLKAGIRKPESGIRKPESGIRNPKIKQNKVLQIHKSRVVHFSHANVKRSIKNGFK